MSHCTLTVGNLRTDYPSIFIIGTETNTSRSLLAMVQLLLREIFIVFIS